MKPIAKSALLLGAVAVSILIGIANGAPTTPSIVSISSDQVRNISESADLNCTVENVELNSVFWTKKVGEGFVILSMGKTLSLPNSRIQLSVVNNSYILKFLRIEANDSSTYTCEVTTSNSNKLTKQVQLIVRTPPKISESLNLNPGPFALHSNAKLDCQSEGYPLPTIYWERHNDAPMPNGGFRVTEQVLTLNNIQQNDRGMYYCISNNGYGEDRRGFQVDVRFPPIITTSRPKVAQRVNFDIELECSVQAFPAPVMSWYKDGKRLESDKEQTITISAGIDQTTVSVLIVHQVETKSYGDYVCRASNSEGQDETRVNLYPQELANINFSGLLMSSARSHHLTICPVILSVLTLLLTTSWLGNCQ